MKKPLLWFAMAWVIAGCNKSASKPQPGSILGRWQLKEYLTDPGDGSGQWTPADPAHPSYIEFGEYGELKQTPSNAYAATRYVLLSDSTLLFIRPTDSLQFRYQLTDALLSLYPPCFEACGERWVPAN